MASSTDSESSRARAPKSSRPTRSSRSRGRSATPPPEPSASRLLFEPRRDLAVPIAVELARRERRRARSSTRRISRRAASACTPARGSRSARASPLRSSCRMEDAASRRAGASPGAKTRIRPRQARFCEAGVRFEVIDEAIASGSCASSASSKRSRSSFGRAPYGRALTQVRRILLSSARLEGNRTVRSSSGATRRTTRAPRADRPDRRRTSPPLSRAIAWICCGRPRRR